MGSEEEQIIGAGAVVEFVIRLAERVALLLQAPAFEALKGGPELWADIPKIRVAGIERELDPVIWQRQLDGLPHIVAQAGV
jgi:hypothetical protein